jgi:hypothetical protein
VAGLDDDRDAARLQHVVDRVGDLRRQLLLDLQPARIGIHDPRKLADADDAPVRQIGDVRAPDDRHHVVLAMAFHPDVAEQNDLVVAVNLLERPLEHRRRVGLITGEKLLV